MSKTPHIDLTVIIPLYNEEGSLEELIGWIYKVVKQKELFVEAILIDDGSTDDSWGVIQRSSLQFPGIKGVRFLRNYGKSAALNTGFKMATGDVIVTMDADLQDSPEELPLLYDMVNSQGYDLVSGWKRKRFDPISKTIPTKLYNWATRRMTGIKLHDFNCGLKAYRNRVVKSIEVAGEMHRYIPVLAKREGFTRIGEKIVEHHPRRYGKSKFGMERFVNGFLDLLTVTFISKFGKRPMHFFGLWGTIMFILGFILFAAIGGYKLWALYENIPAKNIATMSYFYVALTAMIIGTQLFMAGFVAEMVGRTDPRRNNYQISDRVGK